MLTRLINLSILLSLTVIGKSVLAIEVIDEKDWKTAPDVVSFQPFAEILGPVTLGDSGQSVRLVNLNKYVNSWYLLEVSTTSMWRSNATFNIENPAPLVQTLNLGADGSLILKSKSGEITCAVLSKDARSGPAFDALGRDPYMSLCEGRLFLRNQASASMGSIAKVTTGLRFFGSAGEAAVNFVKEQVYDGTFFESGTEVSDPSQTAVNEGGPLAAKISQDLLIAKSGIGIEIADDVKAGLKIGQWYKAKNFAGIFVSVMKAKFVADDILSSYTDLVLPLDNHGKGEADALVDSVAMDLNQYSFGWNNGTKFPDVGWSSRAARPKGASSEGPDGFADQNPLTFPGVVSPFEVSQTVGVLAGGFQRHHSAFRSGPLHNINRSSHYGVMEKGVITSTIVPNLATFIVYLDGTIDIKTWTLADNTNLNKMRDVRQNGVPLIEDGKPSAYVNNWGAGNWSGSAEKELKTPRTSACLVERDGQRYLIFSYFSTHTPSGMARVLQSYGCKYAIHLDMNAPTLAYSAFFTASQDGDFKIEHVSNAMTDDAVVNGKTSPRSLMAPNYKDFFYVIKK